MFYAKNKFGQNCFWQYPFYNLKYQKTFLHALIKKEREEEKWKSAKILKKWHTCKYRRTMGGNQQKLQILHKINTKSGNLFGRKVASLNECIQIQRTLKFQMECNNIGIIIYFLKTIST